MERCGFSGGSVNFSGGAYTEPDNTTDDETDNIFDSIGSALSDFGTWLKEGFGNVVSSITSGITSIKTAIGNVVTDLITSLTDLLKSLFIPSDDFFSDKIDDLVNEFSFVESIVGTVNVISDYFENTDFSQPPKLNITLDINKSKYNWGKNAIAIDFSWYEPYKPSVDIVLSAILYINFAWSVFKDLPNIIQGVGSGATAYSSLENEISKGGN